MRKENMIQLLESLSKQAVFCFPYGVEHAKGFTPEDTIWEGMSVDYDLFNDLVVYINRLDKSGDNHTKAQSRLS